MCCKCNSYGFNIAKYGYGKMKKRNIFILK